MESEGAVARFVGLEGRAEGLLFTPTPSGTKWEKKEGKRALPTARRDSP